MAFPGRQRVAVLLREDLSSRATDGGVSCAGELATWVPSVNGHLAFDLVDELVRGTLRKPHGQRHEHVQDVMSSFAGLVDTDPDELPAGQRRPGGVGGDIRVEVEAASTVECPQSQITLVLKPFRWIDPIGQPSHQNRAAAFDAERPEPPVGALTPGAVAVQGNDGRLGVHGQDSVCLHARDGHPACGGGGEHRQLVGAGRGCCDGQGVDGAFDDHDVRVAVQAPVGWPVERRRIVEDRRPFRVAVLGRPCVAGRIAADESVDAFYVAQHWDDQPTPVGVDSSPLRDGWARSSCSSSLPMTP